MCNSNGTSGLNLLLKSQQDTSVASQHVTEPDGKEAGVAASGHTLHDQLSDTFRGTHHARWVDRFVSGNQDKSLDFEPVSKVGGDSRPHTIVFHRLGGIRLNKRHMLVSGRMEEDAGPMFV